jgi:hypothetical protein
MDFTEVKAIGHSGVRYTAFPHKSESEIKKRWRHSGVRLPVRLWCSVATFFGRPRQRRACLDTKVLHICTMIMKQYIFAARACCVPFGFYSK